MTSLRARTHLFLVRHGETADNARGVFQGQKGGPLSDVGRGQASRLAAHLRALRDADAAHGFHRAYSSDLPRAHETATALVGALGMELALDAALREVDCGAWSGLDEAAVRAQFPDEHAAWAKGVDVRRGGGETYAELGERVLGALERLAEAHAGERVLVVSHGAAIRAAVARAQGLPGFASLTSVRNTAVTELERHEARWTVHRYDDVAHLTAG